MQQRWQNAYIENMVKTASPAKLIELLYMKAIDVLKEAEKFIEEKKYVEANEKIKRAQDIVVELNLSLDLERGGQIAQNLRAIYNYLFQRLIEGNVKKDVGILREVRSFLEDLLETWREVMKRAGNTVEVSSKKKQGGLDISL